MDLVEILAGMTSDDGLALALIVGRDGLLVEGQTRSSAIDLESLSAMATRSLGDLERLGRSLSGGNLAQIRLRFDGYQLLIEMLSPNDVLVAGVAGGSSAERLLDSVARNRAHLQQALSVF